jgi:hypothetical protein
MEAFPLSISIIPIISITVFLKKQLHFRDAPGFPSISIPSNMGFVDFNGDCHADVAIQTHDVFKFIN